MLYQTYRKAGGGSGRRDEVGNGYRGYNFQFFLLNSIFYESNLKDSEKVKDSKKLETSWKFSKFITDCNVTIDIYM